MALYGRQKGLELVKKFRVRKVSESKCGHYSLPFNSQQREKYLFLPLWVNTLEARRA